MDTKAFTLLHGMESSWWYRGRAAVVASMLSRLGARDNLRVLDFGAGYGGMQGTLARYGEVRAFEPEAGAQAALSARGYHAVFASVGEALGHTYDLIGLFDVLEHIEDDAGFLRDAHRALAQGGALALTVPAAPFLWGAHDVLHHHFRRYTKRTLREVLERCGYEVEYLGCWNMFLFPTAALAKLIGKTGESSFALPRPLDSLLYAAVAFEALLIRFMRLPFGISLVALARKT